LICLSRLTHGVGLSEAVNQVILDAFARHNPPTAPVSHKAMIEPMGRREEPKVRTTVASRARLPS
jgi:hypothetical protein